MFKSLSALALAGVIAVTSLATTAAPARADDDAFVKFLFGAAALAIIANELNDHDDVVVVRPHNHKKVYRKHLPSSCRVTVQRPNGKRVKIYTRDCLDRKGYTPVGAPDCRRSAYWNGRNHVYFTAACLRRHGFDV